MTSSDLPSPTLDPATCDVDLLMAHIAEINALDPSALTETHLLTLITYHRRNRARKIAGDKPARTAPGARQDLSSLLGLAKKPAVPALTAPATTGIRRI